MTAIAGEVREALDELFAEQDRIRQELLLLRSLAWHVRNAHREEDERTLHDVCALLVDIVEDLELHLEEEQHLRPHAGRVGEAIARRLADDHAQLRWLFAELRARTGGYALPPSACSTWRELWRRLQALEASVDGQIRGEEAALYGARSPEPLVVTPLG